MVLLVLREKHHRNIDYIFKSEFFTFRKLVLIDSRKDRIIDDQSSSEEIFSDGEQELPS